MTAPIRIGVIGTSWWVDLAHLPYLTTDERVKVVVLSGVDPAGQSVAPSFYDGWQAQRVIDAAVASHERAGWVEV